MGKKETALVLSMIVSNVAEFHPMLPPADVYTCASSLMCWTTLKHRAGESGSPPQTKTAGPNVCSMRQITSLPKLFKSWKTILFRVHLFQPLPTSSIFQTTGLWLSPSPDSPDLPRTCSSSPKLARSDAACRSGGRRALTAASRAHVSGGSVGCEEAFLAEEEGGGDPYFDCFFFHVQLALALETQVCHISRSQIRKLGRSVLRPMAMRS